MTNETLLKIIDWSTSENTGMSSKALCRFMLGIRASSNWGYPAPSDADDRSRCIRLLNLVPEWWDRLDEMAAIPSHRVNYFSGGTLEPKEEGWREQIPFIRKEANHD